jgi:beta-glucanase (GH16 family)
MVSSTLKFKLGLVSSTETIEKKQQALIDEYNKLKSIEKSEKLERYLHLQQFTTSKEFTDKKQYYTTLTFKGSPEEKKENSFLQQKKSNEVKMYYKFKNSQNLNLYNKYEGSNEIKKYQELKNLVSSTAFKAKKKELKDHNSEEYKALQEFKNLDSSSELKHFLKLKTSKELSNYLKIESTKQIPEFETLEKYISSDEFKKQKAYLNDSKKWEKSEEFKQFNEFLSLKKDKEIIWYFKTKDSNKYDILKTWNLTFEDDFTGGQIDKSKWISRYFWGEVLLNDTYALPGEKHIFNQEKNLQFNGSTVKIVTKKEKITGKEWNPMFGFIPKNFEYSSAIINSGCSFRTKYGKIEAKIKINPANGVMHAFWLAGDMMLPQLDIFKCLNNKLYLSTFWGNSTQSDSVNNDSTALNINIVKGKYMIFTLEWSPNAIVWKINNEIVKTQNNNIPDNEFYVALNSGVFDDNADAGNGLYEIDWIRCYQKS